MKLGDPRARERLDALAAQYALGTLSPRAGRRLAMAARSDPAIADAIRAWELRLAALAEACPAVTPSPRVWERVVARLGLEGSSAPAKPVKSRWQRVATWRGLALGSAAAAIALAVALVVLKPTAPAPAYVVVLAGADAHAALVATAVRGNNTLTIKPLAPLAVPTDRELELWALPTGANPRSLGRIPSTGVARVHLARALDAPALAISLEPRGGSPTGLPTGPVIYSGKVEMLE